jgi:sporulation protein YlmC with PRC-barrel domain
MTDITNPGDIRDADRPTATSRAADANPATGALVHARDLDHFTLPEGRADPRGKDVRLADGTTIGKVEDLLVDGDTRQLRYLEIAVADEVVKAGGRDFVLVPMDAARIADDRNDVVVNLSLEDLRDVPVYDRRELADEYERRLREHLAKREHRDT